MFRFFFLLILFSNFSLSKNLVFQLNSSFAAEVKNNVNVKTDKSKDVPEDIQKIFFVPRIKLIEKNSLKSYSWWDKENPKIPNLYKLILKKIKEDFLLEKIDVEYVLKKLNKENMSDYENHFVVFGTLVLDTQNKEEHELKDLSFYQIENGQLKLMIISSDEAQNIKSSFRSMAVNLKDKLTGVVPLTLDNKIQKAEKTYLVVFENDLSYEELNQIRIAIKENLKIELTDVKLLFSETNKYTFQVVADQNPFEALKKVVFVNGPYESEVLDNTLIFKPYTEEDFL